MAQSSSYPAVVTEWHLLALSYGCQNVSLPLKGVLAIQGLSDLLPAKLLVFWVAGHTVEDERQATSCSVMALKHEGVHFCS